MKIFGLNITTAAKYEQTIRELKAKIVEKEELLEAAFEIFPLVPGQVVYDIALKDAKGRFTKTEPSLEHSTITPVEVDEQNYFSLVDRMKRNDVFVDFNEAERYLQSICK